MGVARHVGPDQWSRSELTAAGNATGGKRNKDMGPILSEQEHFREETVREKKPKQKTAEKKKERRNILQG